MPRHSDNFQAPHSPGFGGFPGHPGGFYGMPEAAFTDKSPDKSTKELERTDLYENWRDILVAVSINMALIGAGWWAKTAGYPAMYNFIVIALILIGIGAGVLWFLKIIDVFKKTPSRTNQRMLFTFIGFVLAFALHYWFFS